MADKPPHQQPPSFSNANAIPGPNASINPDGQQQVQLEAKVEDAETRAAREELKHTVITDTQDPSTRTSGGSDPTQHYQQRQKRGEDEKVDEDEEMTLRTGTRRKAPDLTPPEVLSRSGPVSAPEKVSSPKKKRAHDEFEQQKEGDGHRTSSGAESEGGWVMVDGAEKDKEHRSEPQKKRARDETSPPADIHKATATASTSGDPSTNNTPNKDGQAQASSAAFAASGFAKLASSSASPFASAGAKKNVFGGGPASSASPFASIGAATPSAAAAPANLPKPTLSFGSKDASAPSPFATINGSGPSAFGGGGFGGGSGGGAFGGGSSAFGSVLGGSRIGNFASPGAPPIIKSDKPAKPFGAPDSDAEDESDEESNSEAEEGGDSGADGEKEKEKAKDDAAGRDESTPVGGDDEKKAKYKKVVVDDGEAGEATIVQVRARMYYLDKSTNAEGKVDIAWRERGAGMLKINVPVETVAIDSKSAAAADPWESFDPSLMGESTPENPKLVRLLMRQDSTLRVILNTAMAPAMRFDSNEGLKAKSVLFTALEGEEAKPIQVQMKMSVQSADNFLRAVEGIQEKMKGNP